MTYRKQLRNEYIRSSRGDTAWYMYVMALGALMMLPWLIGLEPEVFLSPPMAFLYLAYGACVGVSLLLPDYRWPSRVIMVVLASLFASNVVSQGQTMTVFLVHIAGIAAWSVLIDVMCAALYDKVPERKRVKVI